MKEQRNHVSYWLSVLSLFPGLAALSGVYTSSLLPCGIGRTCHAASVRPAFDLFGTAPLIVLVAVTLGSILLYGQGKRPQLAAGISLFGAALAIVVVIAGWVQFRYQLTYHGALAIGLALAAMLGPNEASESPGMSVPLRGLSAGLVGLTAVGFAYGHRPAPLYDEAALAQLQWKDLTTGTGHTLGDAGADRAVIIFADLTCGVSHRAFDQLLPLARKKNGARFVMHHLNLKEGGEAYRLAAKAEGAPSDAEFWSFVEQCSKIKLKDPDASLAPLYVDHPWAKATALDSRGEKNLKDDLRIAQGFKLRASPTFVLSSPGKAPEIISFAQAQKELSEKH